jgi:hypothetical protein
MPTTLHFAGWTVNEFAPKKTLTTTRTPEVRHLQTGGGKSDEAEYI